MKVLQVHNFYQQGSGEDTQMRQEAALMRFNGWEVLQYFVSNDAIDNLNSMQKIELGIGVFWSHKHYKAIRRLLRSERPNICHVHNFFPLISPSVFAACKSSRVPVVATIHNYRLMCANGLFLRNDMACEDCLSKTMFNGIKHACYRNSKSLTAIAAAAFEAHHALNSWNRNVTRFIALTSFMKEKLVQKGIESEKIYIKPNFIQSGNLPIRTQGEHLLFVGRLDRVKGADMIKNIAESRPNIIIRVLGEGVLKDSFHGLPNVKLLGQQPHEKVLEEISQCRAVVLPTRFYEGMPLSVIEAFACGKPVITTNHGALPEMVTPEITGWLFEPNNLEDLLRCVDQATSQNFDAASFEMACLDAYQTNYSVSENFDLLSSIYQSAIHDR
jgi:glycosyltransferase involved in cell wall biosynthesis